MVANATTELNIKANGTGFIVNGKGLSRMFYSELKELAEQLELNVDGLKVADLKAAVTKALKARVEPKKPAQAKTKKSAKEKSAPAKKESTKKPKAIKNVIKKITAKKDGEKKPRNSRAQQIRDMHLAGKSVDEIKEAMGITTGHYVSDVIWNLNNKK